MKKPLYPKKWLNKPARYSKNTLSIDGFQVMQRWEEPYMADLASIASKNGGAVLEIGFGMGISTGYIQKEKKVKKILLLTAIPRWSNTLLSSLKSK